jgi:Xaa-Pro aminopeptidase
MTTYLVYDSPQRSPELLHEIGGEVVPDPIAFIEHDGTRIVVGSPNEESVFERREDVVDEFWSDRDFGFAELSRDNALSDEQVGGEVVTRVLQKVGTKEVNVPPTFRVGVADYLRGAGIDIVVDPDEWTTRRRRKTPWEVEGIERAQRAAETAMLTAARMLGEAEPTDDGLLRLDGEIVTAEWIREAMSAELLTQGAESQDMLIHSGDAALRGHDKGSGPILVDRPCIIDCYPRELSSGAFTDMTRTFVPGIPSREIERLHSHCRAALDIALECCWPGRSDAYKKVTDYFRSNGFPVRDDAPSGQISEGFIHGLGHGVGLEVHEPPDLSFRSDELIEGDVIAVEPGLYFEGIGGVRLEDTVLVTADGPEHFTDAYPYDLSP